MKVFNNSIGIGNNNAVKIAKTEVFSPAKKPQTLSLNQTFCGQINDPSRKLLAKKTTIIPQKCFRISKHSPSVDDAQMNYKYIEKNSCWSDKKYSQFSEKVNPKTLEILDGHIKSTNVSNYSLPFGTVGLSSNLDECITTDGLRQCAGVALIDKKHNLQTLIHVCPTIPNEANEKLLNYVLTFSKPEDLEIYIAPGEFEETDKTIEFIVDTIKDNDKDYNINFVNFPDHRNTTLVLRNGELTCTSSKNNHIKEKNPEDRIIYA